MMDLNELDMLPLFAEFNEDFKAFPDFKTDFVASSEINVETLKNMFSCIDLTSLNTTDSSSDIDEFCNKVAQFKSSFPDMPDVAAVCVYPVFASVLATRLKNMKVNRAVVSACFPSSQTFLDIKKEETKKAIFFGANEIDIVMSVGEFLEGNYEFVGNEIFEIKQVMGDAHLKVILETGALPDSESIWKASLIAMEAGADFIKTSTGKMSPAATPEAAWVMTHAIKAFHKKRGKMIGFKPAGGIATVDDALLYHDIQLNVLGKNWVNNNFFRIGASRLANELIIAIKRAEGLPEPIKYF
ncbi:deoxyribose-phosphate aldolase [Alkalitalea saponilacus]|uniref:Deoxyribose-phosphate aldolase n=1 Tax=Alkalitalea saponilacus TaxID=889453 RepID=A0A1T5E980_9BACT|nr:deoxyribose-phosphate aldolase [Alkalitalea saponilacus]SKB80632.1 deoxyribose-phosphate aldolase [Alkalitalea saponilacus]